MHEVLALIISIHAPRAGSDKDGIDCPECKNHFNPRSPCGERLVGLRGDTVGRNFNPRSPCGERPAGALPLNILRDFNPRSPCGERPDAALFCGAGNYISIHAPRAGSDSRAAIEPSQEELISIHAPRAGSDETAIRTHLEQVDFNPRSPCGERLHPIDTAQTPGYFNPRSPCGERQQYIVLLQAQSAIYTQSAILSIVNAIKGRRLLIEFGAKACGISCVLQIRTHKTSGSSTGIVSFEP